jgi:hypothetical protein
MSTGKTVSGDKGIKRLAREFTIEQRTLTPTLSLSTGRGGMRGRVVTRGFLGRGGGGENFSKTSFAKGK